MQACGLLLKIWNLGREQMLKIMLHSELRPRPPRFERLHSAGCHTGDNRGIFKLAKCFSRGNSRSQRASVNSRAYWPDR